MTRQPRVLHHFKNRAYTIQLELLDNIDLIYSCYSLFIEYITSQSYFSGWPAHKHAGSLLYAFLEPPDDAPSLVKHSSRGPRMGFLFWRKKRLVSCQAQNKILRLGPDEEPVSIIGKPPVE